MRLGGEFGDGGMGMGELGRGWGEGGLVGYDVVDWWKGVFWVLSCREGDRAICLFRARMCKCAIAFASIPLPGSLTGPVLENLRKGADERHGTPQRLLGRMIVITTINSTKE